jgi:ribosomal protein S17E
MIHLRNSKRTCTNKKKYFNVLQVGFFFNYYDQSVIHRTMIRIWKVRNALTGYMTQV